MLDLIAPTSQLVHLIKQKQTGLSSGEWTLPDFSFKPSEDLAERSGLFAQQLEIESHKEDVSCGHSLG
jgi:hypothetical protein